jgi:hypothetical protein
MLSYLNCEDDDYELITYLETKVFQSIHRKHYHNPLIAHHTTTSIGKQFLRNCKFGTLQYCIVKPFTAIFAVILHWTGHYEEGNLALTNAYIYFLLLMNISVFYAFVSLMSFYTKLKYKLAPFHPIGKFLCIKFVIFFAFWQVKFYVYFYHH